jgi:hypothetical protein
VSRPRESPALTLGDCLVKVRDGRKTLTEALRTSLEKTTEDLIKHGGDQRTEIQNRRVLDPVTVLRSRSVITVGTCGLYLTKTKVGPTR